MNFRVSINANEVATFLGQTVANISDRLQMEVEKLSIMTHAFIIKKVNDELKGYKRQAFLGPENKNVRWFKISDSIWVVELDESVRWLEEGRPQTSMATTDWLLKGPIVARNQSGVHQAKDGSLYRAIPFVHASSASSHSMPVLEGMVLNALKRERISLRKIERTATGQPKIGVLHKITMEPPGTQRQFPSLFSKPRTREMAALIGLPAHSGIFKLKDLVVLQRINQQGRVIKEAVTFRTVSSKHRAEKRWEYPTVQPLNSLGAAHEWAKQQWELIVKQLEQELTPR